MNDAILQFSITFFGAIFPTDFFLERFESINQLNARKKSKLRILNILNLNKTFMNVWEIWERYIYWFVHSLIKRFFHFWLIQLISFSFVH